MQENKNIIFSLFFSTTIILVGFYFITNNQLKKIQNEHTKNENNLIEKIDTTKEHIIGPKNAEIFLISYLDLECPSCKKFHNIEKTLIKNYKGKSIAFVYRHFPLYKSLGKREAIHPTAGAEAIATECVAKLSNEKQF
jgi:protein-disulfide isomerase